jgi:predicted Zn-dependent protease with MMP-like domain
MAAETEYDLLGLFQGLGLPFQSVTTPMAMPNMIWLYRRPILDYWAEHEETLGAVITHVLVHEIGHHFGLSDADMEAIEAGVE